jgi:hypothetical protein
LAIYVNPAEARGASETGGGQQENPYTSFSSLSGNGFADNETILIKSGTFTRQFLNINQSTNFTLGSYGTGAKPIISGLEVDTNTWTADADDVWYTDVEPNTATPLSSAFAYVADGVKLINYESLVNLIAAGTGQFCSPTTTGTTRIYVRLNGGNPNSAVMEATTGVRAAFISECTNGIITDLEAVYGANACWSIEGSAATGMQAIDLVARNGGSYRTGGGFANTNFALYQLSATGHSQGVQVRGLESHGAQNTGCEFGRLDGAIFEDNKLYDCGMAYEMYNSTINSEFRYNEAYRTYMWFENGGLFTPHGNLFWLTDNTVAADTGNHSDNLFEFNLGADSRQYMIDTGVTCNGNKFRNNTLYQPLARDLRAKIIQDDSDVGTNNEYVNNICYAGADCTPFNGIGTGSPAVNNNLYFSEGNAYLWRYQNSAFNTDVLGRQQAFTNFLAASGGVDRYDQDPLFVNAAANNYNLTEEAPVNHDGEDWWSPSANPVDAAGNTLRDDPSYGYLQFTGVDMTTFGLDPNTVDTNFNTGSTAQLTQSASMQLSDISAVLPANQVMKSARCSVGAGAGGAGNTTYRGYVYLAPTPGSAPTDIVATSTNTHTMAGQGSAIGNLEIASFTFADDPLPEGQQIVIAVGREDVTGLGSARFGAVGVAGGNISYRDDGVNGPATFTADQSITDYVAFEGTYEEGATGAPTLTTPYSIGTNNGPLFVATSSDTIATIEAANFLDGNAGWASLLKTGDVLMMQASNGTKLYNLTVDKQARTIALSTGLTVA